MQKDTSKTTLLATIHLIKEKNSHFIRNFACTLGLWAGKYFLLCVFVCSGRAQMESNQRSLGANIYLEGQIRLEEKRRVVR
jgi:hypothetical protein